ncbi:MAG TPA: hypothetical protein VGE34_03105 [Candidatus Saccharimonadales bacterium]
MINLISYDKKTDIKAGRINVILLRYVFMVLAANVLLIIILVGAYFSLSFAYANAQQQVTQNEQNSASFKSVEQQAAEFRSDLTTAKSILDKEVAYSKLIIKIAHVVPSGVVLDGLSLDSKTLGTPTTLNAKARDTAAVEELSKKFKAETALFSDVKLESIDFSEGTTKYPVSVTLGLTINKEALR